MQPARTAAGGRDLRRERLALAVRSTGRGRRAALAELVENALAATWAEALPGTGLQGRRGEGPDADGVALAAVGSVARRDAGPASDLDLVLLHDGRRGERVTVLADRLWYPLWDAGLRLDHSVRTPAQCRDVAGGDLAAAVGLLDLRPLAGDAGLVVRTRAALLTDWRGRHPAPPPADPRGAGRARRTLRRGRAPARARPQGEPGRPARRHHAARADDELGDRRPARRGRGRPRAAARRPRRAARGDGPVDRTAAARRAGRRGGRLRARRRRRAARRRVGVRPGRSRTPSRSPSGARGRRCRPGAPAARAAPGCARSAAAWSSTTARWCSAAASAPRTIPCCRCGPPGPPSGPVCRSRPSPSPTWPSGARRCRSRGRQRPARPSSTCWAAATALPPVWEALDLAGLVTALAAGVGGRAQPAAAQRRPPAHRRPAPGRDRRAGAARRARRLPARPPARRGPAARHRQAARGERPLPGGGAAGLPGGRADGAGGRGRRRRRAAGPRAPHAGGAGDPA